MYDDSPEWRMMFALLECLYSQHPVREDIAGTVESIAEISPEMLYDCVRAFYDPTNLVLAAAGNISTRQVLEAVERAGFADTRPVVRRLPVEEPGPVATARREFSMSVAKPMLGIGYKETPPTAENQLRVELLCDMMAELVCGSMTPLYRQLYDQGLTSADFGGEFLSLDNALCLLFSGETDQPEKVRQMLLEEIERLRSQGVDRELFTLCKNQMYGQLVCELDSVTGAAGALCSSALKGRSLYEEMTQLVKLTAEDMDQAFQTMLLPENSATVVIWPDSRQEAE